MPWARRWRVTNDRKNSEFGFRNWILIAECGDGMVKTEGGATMAPPSALPRTFRFEIDFQFRNPESGSLSPINIKRIHHQPVPCVDHHHGASVNAPLAVPGQRPKVEFEVERQHVEFRQNDR